VYLILLACIMVTKKNKLKYKKVALDIRIDVKKLDIKLDV